MQTAEHDGINCDLCGTTYKKDFTYYSFDLRSVQLVNRSKPQLQAIFRSPIKLAVDVCGLCFDKIAQNAIHLNTVNRGIFCEVTGKPFPNTCVYYHCNVVKVVVRMEGQPFVCTKCSAKTFNPIVKCACGNTSIIQVADVQSTDRFVEINISEEVASDWLRKLETNKKVAGEWATKS